MAIRDLVCILEATEKPSTAPLAQALALAKTYGAEASVLVAAPKASAPYSLFSVGTISDLVKRENDLVRSRAESLSADVKAELSKAGCKGGVDLQLESYQTLLQRAREYALCNDLTVISRPGGVIEHSEVLFEEMLFTAGRPVLLPVPDAKPIERVNKMIVAWDGSTYAARALSSALALFGGMEEAEVVVVRGEKDLSEMVPAAKAVAHIGRHGLSAKAVELKTDSEGVSSTINTHAVKSGADLVVMGAFGRSRLREFVLGGVTRNLTRFSSRPLLVSH